MLILTKYISLNSKSNIILCYVFFSNIRFFKNINVKVSLQPLISLRIFMATDFISGTKGP